MGGRFGLRGLCFAESRVPGPFLRGPTPFAASPHSCGFVGAPQPQSLSGHRTFSAAHSDESGTWHPPRGETAGGPIGTGSRQLPVCGRTTGSRRPQWSSSEQYPVERKRWRQ